MKNFIVKLAVITALLPVLSGCNGTNDDFNKVHIYRTHKCYRIAEWKACEGGRICVRLSDGSMILTNTLEAMLVWGKCPICLK